MIPDSHYILKELRLKYTINKNGGYGSDRAKNSIAAANLHGSQRSGVKYLEIQHRSE